MISDVFSKKYNRKLKEYELDRFETLTIKFQKLTNTRYDWREVEKWWTLSDIATSTWKYEKFFHWYQKAYEEKRKKEMNREITVNELIEREDPKKEYSKESLEDQELRKNATEIQKNALELMMWRNVKYWDSWKVLTIQSLANLCEMKLHRIARLWEMEAKTEDELIDVMNYCVFGLMKLEELKK